MVRSHSSASPARGRRTAVVWALLALASVVSAPDAGAQITRPWTPPNADGLLNWAAQVRVRFQANTGDSVGGDNYRAYEMVSERARDMLSAMGRSRMIQAYAVETIMDSLGLDTEVELDPHLPYFVLLMVRNPFNRAAASVGYFYWYRQDDLRVQGALFHGGMNPKMRVWWTGTATAPYAWGVVDEQRGDNPQLGLTLLHLNPDGLYWNLLHYPGDGLDLGGDGTAEWVDMNGDGHPELVTWVRGPVDTTFVQCSECPRPIVQRTFVGRRSGFELEDSRLLSTPYATIMLFMRLLADGNHEGAERLLGDPAMLDEALELGWNRAGRDSWRFLNSEPQERWPRWISMEFRSEDGRRSYIFRFAQLAGRWVIEEWKPVIATGGDSSG